MVWHDMAWYGMAWFGSVWYGLVWFGKDCCPFKGISPQIRPTLRPSQLPFVNIFLLCLTWYGRVGLEVWYGMVWFGLVWFGMV